MSKQRHTPSLVLERIARSRTTKPVNVVGIDEVGTGAWAGPIVVGAVAFEDDEEKLPISVRDSKLLNSNTRKELLTFTLSHQEVERIEYFGRNELVVILHDDTVQVWNIDTGQMLNCSYSREQVWKARPRLEIKINDHGLYIAG